MGGLKFGQGQFGQVAGFGLGQGDERACDVMRLPEGQAEGADEPVGKVGRGGKARGGGGLQDGAVGGHVADHAGHRGEGQHEGVGGVEDLFLVLLHVFGIGQGQALHHGEKCYGGPQNAAQFGAQKLGRVGVFLLRHDGGAGGPAVGQSDKAKLGGGPDHQFLGKAAEVHGADAGGREEFEREVAVGDAVERVGGGAVEAQGAGRHVAVDGEGGSGEGGGPQGAFVHAVAGVGKARAVARQHLDIGQHVVAPGDGLGHLQMGEAGHDPVGALFGLSEEGPHQGGQAKDRRVALVADPKAEVGGDLVVAAASGVQAFAGVADQVGQSGFDVEVDVFKVGAEGEFAGLDL